MNHCLIQSVINSSPQMRYTKENKTPIAEMTVNFKGLRNEDPFRELKVTGWGVIAQEMIEQLKEGDNIVLEGRLRMNSITRKDGTKEKQAELTVSRIHHITPIEQDNIIKKTINPSENKKDDSSEKTPNNTEWNSSPLVPEVDEIPF